MTERKERKLEVRGFGPIRVINNIMYVQIEFEDTYLKRPKGYFLLDVNEVGRLINMLTDAKEEMKK